MLAVVPAFGLAVIVAGPAVRIHLGQPARSAVTHLAADRAGGAGNPTADPYATLKRLPLKRNSRADKPGLRHIPFGTAGCSGLGAGDDREEPMADRLGLGLVQIDPGANDPRPGCQPSAG